MVSPWNCQSFNLSLPIYFSEERQKQKLFEFIQREYERTRKSLRCLFLKYKQQGKSHTHSYDKNNSGWLKGTGWCTALGPFLVWAVPPRPSIVIRQMFFELPVYFNLYQEPLGEQIIFHTARGCHMIPALSLALKFIWLSTIVSTL